jgi:aminoglycoside phosphotransferase (APT) family kinase protein
MRFVPKDPVFPDLAEYVGAGGVPPAVAELIEPMAPKAIDLRHGELRFFRYRPAKRCLFLWGFPQPSGRMFLVSGTLLRSGEGEEIVSDGRYQDLAQQAAALTDARRVFSFLSERRLLLHVFPFDPTLPGLLQATSESWVAENLSAALGDSSGASRVRTINVVNFKPWRRCTLTYELESAGERRRYFAKMLPAGQANTLLPRLRALAFRLEREEALWDVPEALFSLPEAGALVFETVQGEAAKSLLARAPFDPAARKALLRLATVAAEGLVPYQRAVFPGLPALNREDLLADLADELLGLELIAPSLANSVARLIDRLQAEAARLPSEPNVLGHASFRHSHFILRGDRPVLLDLDGVCLCGPSADPGNFLAYLDRAALRRPEWWTALRECERAFNEGLAHLPDLSTEWLTWHRVAAHLKGALRSVSSLSTRWFETAQGLVHLAEKTLAQPAKTLGACAGNGLTPEESLHKAPMDERLPGLPAILDVDFIRARIGRNLVNDPLTSRTLQIDSVRYRPGASCLVGYIFGANDSDGRAPGEEVRWYGRCFSGEDFDAALAKLEARCWVQSVGDEPVIPLPEHRAVLFAYPNDRRLHGLELLHQEGALKAFLHCHLKGESLATGEVVWTIVRYKPEQRAVVRCHIKSSGAHDSVAPKTYYLRIFPDDRGLREYQAMRALARSLQVAGELAIPKPRAFDRRWHALLLDALPGSKLKATVAAGCAQDAFRRAGRALAALHAHCNSSATPRCLPDHMARARHATRLLSRVMPDREPQLDDVARRLDALAPHAEADRIGFVHGDFHSGQVLVTGDRIGLVDFERAHNGPVLFDLGNWLAVSVCRRLEGKWTGDGPLWQCLLDGYRKVAREEVPRKAIAWWTAIALLPMITKPLRRLEKDATAKVTALLDQLGVLIGEC